MDIIPNMVIHSVTASLADSIAEFVSADILPVNMAVTIARRIIPPQSLFSI